MSNADSLGDRMKQYEDVSRVHLTRRLPVIIRLDGKAFHTWTRGLERPYCQPLITAMNEVTKALCAQVQNVAMAYTQSDEISLLLVDYQDIKTDPWFGSNLQKMVSVAASIAGSKLTALSPSVFNGPLKEAVFDARAFVLPESEVCNYFIWRQQDWNRNSLQMLAQSLYSQKELEGKGRAEQHDLCFKKGYNWADLDSHLKDGRVVQKHTVKKMVHFRGSVLGNPEGEDVEVERSEWQVLPVTPVFSQNRRSVDHHVPGMHGAPF